MCRSRPSSMTRSMPGRSGSKPRSRLRREGGDNPLTQPSPPRGRGLIGSSPLPEGEGWVRALFVFFLKNPLPRLRRYFPQRGKIFRPRSSPSGGSGAQRRRGPRFLSPPHMPCSPRRRGPRPFHTAGSFVEHPRPSTSSGRGRAPNPTSRSVCPSPAGPVWTIWR